MGLTKVHGFKGEAEVLGADRAVEFTDGELRIKVASYAEATEVLAALSGRAPAQRPVPLVQETEPARPELAQAALALKAKAQAEKQARELPPWDPKKEFPDEPTQEAPKREPPPKPAPPPEPTPQPAPPEPSKGLDMAEEKPTVAAPEMAGGIPPEIQNAPNVISILDWLVKNRGVSPKDVNAMVAAVQEIAPQVGLLRRMGAKLPERISSTLQMFKEGGG